MMTLLKLISYPFLFLFGVIVFLLTSKTPNQGYAGFRYLFVKTDGRINDILSKIISTFFQPYKISYSKGILGDLHQNDILEITAEIRKKGYYQFKQKLDSTYLDMLMNYAKVTPVSTLDLTAKKISYDTKKLIFNADNPISPRYQFEGDQLLENPMVREIVFDENLLHIANTYLNTKPILDIVTMWWSAPFKEKGIDKAAQMYHFDMDRIKFLKFFFYLTDVNTNSGPHCYIEGTNSRIPISIRRDGRISDFDVLKIYGEDKIKEFTGPAGTILAVDTRGLHKGKPLVTDNRLLFQIQFSNILFGAPYHKFNFDSRNVTNAFKYKRTYSLFTKG